jgi:hypothetical protein
MIGATRKEGVTTLTTIGARGGWRFLSFRDHLPWEIKISKKLMGRKF